MRDETPGAMSEQLQIRVYGPETRPTLVYLPGLHGDWTLVGSFRRELGSRVRFVEVTYPRTLTWSLEDYAAAVAEGLERQGIRRGWLLGESFGSQVLWAMAAQHRFSIEGLILAGGFVRHPMRWGVRLAKKVTGGLPLKLQLALLAGWAKVARLRFGRSPEVLQAIEQFLARRTELDRQAVLHRLRLIETSNLCAAAGETRFPVYALTGLVDPVVPWFPVRRWLRRNCAALRDYRIVRRADHTILATAPQPAAEIIYRWMTAEDRSPDPTA